MLKLKAFTLSSAEALWLKGVREGALPVARRARSNSVRPRASQLRVDQNPMAIAPSVAWRGDRVVVSRQRPWVPPLCLAEQRADQVVRASTNALTNPPGYSPLGFPGILRSRNVVSRAARMLFWAQCMAMLEPQPTVSFLPHPPARKRFPLIRPGKLSGMQALHYFASISLMTSTLVTPSELPVIRQGVFHASRGWTIQVPLDTYRFGQVRQALQGFVNLAGDRISA